MPPPIPPPIESPAEVAASTEEEAPPPEEESPEKSANSGKIFIAKCISVPYLIKCYFSRLLYLDGKPVQ
jgi:hypothetical protein